MILALSYTVMLVVLERATGEEVFGLIVLTVAPPGVLALLGKSISWVRGGFTGPQGNNSSRGDNTFRLEPRDLNATSDGSRPPMTAMEGGGMTQEAEIENRSPFWVLWLKCSAWVYSIGCILGFLSNGAKGAAVAIGAGVILAPIKGLIIAAIIRAVSRR